MIHLGLLLISFAAQRIGGIFPEQIVVRRRLILFIVMRVLTDAAFAGVVGLLAV